MVACRYGLSSLCSIELFHCGRFEHAEWDRCLPDASSACTSLPAVFAFEFDCDLARPLDPVAAACVAGFHSFSPMPMEKVFPELPPCVPQPKPSRSSMRTWYRSPCPNLMPRFSMLRGSWRVRLLATKLLDCFCCPLCLSSEVAPVDAIVEAKL